jgi:hypothetical protein
VFPHVGFGLERDPARPIQLTASLLLGGETRATVDHRPPADEPVRLVLPACGAVDVAVLTTEGTPARGDTLVGLGPARPEDWAPGSMFMGTQRLRTTWVEEGRAHFERVGLGLALELRTESFHDRSRARALIEGPPLAP